MRSGVARTRTGQRDGTDSELRIRWPQPSEEQSERERRRADRPRARRVYRAEKRAALRHRELVPVEVTGLVRRMCRAAGLEPILVLDDYRSGRAGNDPPPSAIQADHAAHSFEAALGLFTSAGYVEGMSLERERAALGG